MANDSVFAKRNINMLVTVSHIVVILAATVSQFVIFFSAHKPTREYRMDLTFTFFGGMADLFLSVMLWFILDSDKGVGVFVDGDRVYAV